MGLLFKLKIDLRDSQGPRLSLASTKRKIAMGGAFLFGAVFLGVMTFAALPLFKLFWEQGDTFDRLVVIFFASALVIYPIFVFICLAFEDRCILTLNPQTNKIDLVRFKKIFFIKFYQEKLSGLRYPEDFHIENWREALNVAALSKNPDAKLKQYATKGHWMMLAKDGNGKKVVFERRAKKEDIEWLQLLIEQYFSRNS